MPIHPVQLRMTRTLAVLLGLLGIKNGTYNAINASPEIKVVVVFLCIVKLILKGKPGKVK